MARFDGTGERRFWPLLIGERAYYALAAGNETEARSLLAVMKACTSPGGLLPEQVWDMDGIAHAELFRGKPTGSAVKGYAGDGRWCTDRRAGERGVF